MPDITDVGLDMDGVIYPFAEAFRSYCCHRLSVPDLPAPTDWAFYRDWGITDDEFPTVLNEATRDANVFAMLPPEAGTHEGWACLRDMGIRIHVITHRPQSAWAQTAQWLDDHGLVADSLTFAKDKTVITHFAAGSAAMLEDYIVNHDHLLAAGVHAVLMDRPWNEGHEGVRVRSLGDFATYVHDLSNDKEMA